MNFPLHITFIVFYPFTPFQKIVISYNSDTGLQTLDISFFYNDGGEFGGIGKKRIYAQILIPPAPQ
jgi:hypothetical protein